MTGLRSLGRWDSGKKFERTGRDKACLVCTVGVVSRVPRAREVSKFLFFTFYFLVCL